MHEEIHDHWDFDTGAACFVFAQRAEKQAIRGIAGTGAQDDQGGFELTAIGGQQEGVHRSGASLRYENLSENDATGSNKKSGFSHKQKEAIGDESNVTGGTISVYVHVIRQGTGVANGRCDDRPPQ